MIQRTELRIGNKAKQAFAILTIVEIGSFDALCANDQRACNCKYENLEGIELTPEILEGFGTLEGRCFYIKNDGEAVRFMMWDNHFGEYYYDNGNNKIHVQYLHQLQNLYHALTGTELPVNIKEKV